MQYRRFRPSLIALAMAGAVPAAKAQKPLTPDTPEARDRSKLEAVVITAERRAAPRTSKTCRMP
jgi:hypothetical protein